ncbi:MAG: Ig-like domain-containing protein, partial [Candidatus Caldarchaeum sp.]
DVDPDGDVLQVVEVNGQALQCGQPVQVAGGALTMHCDGSFRYEPAQGFVGDDCFTYTVSDGANTSTGEAILYTVPVKGLLKVDFSGYGYWWDFDLDGAVDEKEAATAVSSDSLWVDEVGIVLDGDWPLRRAVHLRATRGNDVWIKPTIYAENQWYGANDELTLLSFQGMFSQKKLPNRVAAYTGASEFDLTWELTSNYGQPGEKWVRVKTSYHPLYVTLRDPIISPDNHGVGVTLLHLGSTLGEGQQTDDGVIGKVWEQFATLNVFTEEGQKLHFYRDFRTTMETTSGLITDKDGQSRAWASLLIDVFKAQGISEDNNLVKISPDPNRVLPQNLTQEGRNYFSDKIYMLLKNWDFSALPKANAAIVHDSNDPDPDFEALIRDFPYLNVLGLYRDFAEIPPVGQQFSTSYYWLYSDVRDQQGIPGQGTPNPGSLVKAHSLVAMRFDGKTNWFDPSYGKRYDQLAPADRLASFESNMISGFGVLLFAPIREQVVGVDLNEDNDLNDTVERDILLIKKQNEDLVETKSEISTI